MLMHDKKLSQKDKILMVIYLFYIRLKSTLGWIIQLKWFTN
jgi:hypothetical protein